MRSGSEPGGLAGGAVDEVMARALAGERPVETELVLRCSRTGVDAGRSPRLAELFEQGPDWAYVLGMARSHGVVPLLHRALRSTRGLVPADVLRDLRVDAYALAALVHLHTAELREIVRACEAEGLRALPFKGPALGALAYGDAYRRRPGGDLDVLTRREDFGRVREILVARGYRPRVPAEEEDQYLRTRSGSAFERDTGAVDLHWTLEQKAFDGLPFSFRLDPDQVYSHATTVDLDGEPVQTLRAEDALLYLCAHGAKHSWAALFSVCDVAELVRTDLDWDWVEAEARRQRTGRILHLGLLLAQGLLGAGLPDGVRRRAEGDARARALARQVGGRILDPESTAGDTWLSFPDTVRHYWFRLGLLERPGEKAVYLAFRGLRKLSNRLPHQEASGRSASS